MEAVPRHPAPKPRGLIGLGVPAGKQPFLQGPCAVVLDLESGGPSVGFCFHPLASDASTIKWVLLLPKIPVRRLACCALSKNGRYCHDPSADLGCSLRVETRGLAALIFLQHQRPWNPPPQLKILSPREEVIIHPMCKWKN